MFGGGKKVIIQKSKDYPVGKTSFIAIKIHYGTCNMMSFTQIMTY